MMKTLVIVFQVDKLRAKADAAIEKISEDFAQAKSQVEKSFQLGLETCAANHEKVLAFRESLQTHLTEVELAHCETDIHVL